MNITKKIMTISFLSVAFISPVALTSCDGSSSSSGTAAVEAPSSINGEVFFCRISSGSGLFATTGVFLFAVSGDGNTYEISGDRANVADSGGNLVYSSTGSLGLADIEDTVVVGFNALYTLDFKSVLDSNTSGSFSAVPSDGSAGEQVGTFEVAP